MGDFITIATLKSWLGLTSAVYTVVAVIKSMRMRKFTAWQLRGMAFLTGLIILTLLAVADGTFVLPWHSPANVLAAGLLLINAFALVISTAGFHEIYKGQQGQTVPPLFEEEEPAPIPDLERASQDETLEKAKALQSQTTAEEGESHIPS
ncbi:MAG TPA: hypothetical protein GX716_00610 [Firmicutes bacterium]|nr:hypothetical protein [Candidatus Fermentithermobacillaceae bacterium]